MKIAGRKEFHEAFGPKKGAAVAKAVGRLIDDKIRQHERKLIDERAHGSGYYINRMMKVLIEHFNHDLPRLHQALDLVARDFFDDRGATT